MSIQPLFAAFIPLAILAPCATAQLAAGVNDETIQEPFITVSAGTTVAISGDVAAVTTPGGFFVGDGVVRFYDRSPSGAWVLANFVVPPVTGTAEGFGTAVVVEGSSALVGEPGAFALGGPGTSPGEVHVVERVGTTWLVTASVAPPNSANGDRFGSAIAVDGDLMLVGATGGNAAAGAAHVFRRDALTGTWLHEAELTAGDDDPGDAFGNAVEWANGRAIVGAPQDDTGQPDTGAVYVFEETAPGVWSETAKLVTSTLDEDDLFGRAIAAEGDRLAIISPGLSGGGFAPGGAFVFERDSLTGSWSETAILRVPFGPNLGLFPQVSAIALDNDRIVIGHPSEVGSVHVFEPAAGGAWRPAVRLESDSMPARGFPSVPYAFGSALAIDGDRLLVSAPGSAPFGLLGASGAVFEFRIGTLYHNASTAQLPGPAAQKHFLRATDARAGDFYYFLGTASGTTPGTPDPVTGINIPINVDAYTLFLINSGGAGLVSPLGVLDANGEAQSAYVLPPGTGASFAGLELHHCYLIIDSTTLVGDEASNPVRVRVIL